MAEGSPDKLYGPVNNVRFMNMKFGNWFIEPINIDETTPWILAKNPDKRPPSTVHNLAEVVRIVSVYIGPPHAQYPHSDSRTVALSIIILHGKVSRNGVSLTGLTVSRKEIIFQGLRKIKSIGFNGEKQKRQKALKQQ